jgi:hypothetical protein
MQYMVAPHGLTSTAIGGVKKANQRVIFGLEFEAGSAGSDAANGCGALYRFDFRPPRPCQIKITRRIFKA